MRIGAFHKSSRADGLIISVEVGGAEIPDAAGLFLQCYGTNSARRVFPISAMPGQSIVVLKGTKMFLPPIARSCGI